MLCCMSTRTQVYLTDDQRERIDRLASVEKITLAEVVRRALDRYLADEVPDPVTALASTFGADPGASAPDRSTWDRA